MPGTLRTALVAEDNGALCRVIGLTLRKAGFAVTTSSDGAEAWEHASRSAYDLVVTDQQMPRMTGLELVERLRESESNATTPVVLLTAKGLELETDQVRDRYGVSALLHKPFSPAELARLADGLVSELV